MKIGDVVMFKPEGHYSKWFGAHLAVVQSCSYNRDGKLYCRVKWIHPVKYFDGYSTISDFCADKFEVFDGGR